MLFGLGLLTALQVAAEMLEEGDLLLQVLGVLVESVLVSEVLTVYCATLNVVKVIVVRI